MSNTKSETLFEEFCNNSGIQLSKILEVPGHRRADYKVRTPTGKAVVEIKEITPNPDDRRQAKELKVQESTGGGRIPGERIRNCLRSASSQLRKFSLRHIPTMVVIFDMTYSVSYTDTYSVKAGMYGLDAIVLARTNNARSLVVGVKSGGRQVMTDRHNTSISAVGILRNFPKDPPVLFVYHNRFARVAFRPECLRDYVAAQKALPEPDGITIPDWVDA